jgi:hypothetical protein
MKKLLFTIVTLAFSAILLTSSCSKDSKDNNKETKDYNNLPDTKEQWKCGSYNGHTLYTGPRGGCYYYQKDGDKTYVDRKNCTCLKN